MKIEQGDRVKVTMNGDGGWFGDGWAEGIVLWAQNYGVGDDENWYVEFVKDKVEGRHWETGYGYWKQGVDGGKMEVIEKAEYGIVARAKLATQNTVAEVTPALQPIVENGDWKAIAEAVCDFGEMYGGDPEAITWLRQLGYEGAAVFVRRWLT